MSYQINELKSLFTDLSKDIRQQMRSQEDRISRLEQAKVALEGRITALETQAAQPSPLPAFVKFGTAALGILSALLGAVAIFGHK